MINLQKASGIPLLYDEASKKLISPVLRMNHPDIRTIEQMHNVLVKKDAFSPREFYYMYRNISLDKDAFIFQNHHLSYDITIIPGAMIGNEFVKTLGHYHSSYNVHLSYPEIYEVLYGEALYLLQREDLNDIIFCKAKEGDKVLIPPNYGHITINASNRDLVMSNLVSTVFKSNYEPIVQREGGSYYVINENGAPKYVKNIRYPNTPRPRELEPAQLIPPNLILPQEPLYRAFTNNQKLFAFLSKPDLLYYETQRIRRKENLL